MKFRKYRGIKKERDITLLTKFCMVIVVVFPVVMCWDMRIGPHKESHKEAECQRIDALELWC